MEALEHGSPSAGPILHPEEPNASVEDQRESGKDHQYGGEQDD
jgi:hypothetical protein